MRRISQKELLILNEGNPFTNMARTAFGIAGNAAKGIGKSVLSQDLGDAVSGAAKSIRNLEPRRSRLDRQYKQSSRRRRSLSKRGRHSPEQRTRRKTTPQIESAIIRANVAVDRYFTAHGKQSIAIGDLPTLPRGAKSSKFAIIEKDATLSKLIYPYTSGKSSTDTGFVIWNSRNSAKKKNTLEDISTPLKNTKLISIPGFVTLEQ